jgi:D-alanine-D-alanine ligase
MGGIGGEREVSLESGRHVAAALRQAGCTVATADTTPDSLSILDENSIEVFFIALHGKFGEDGTLQEILESRGLCYTGSGPKASRAAMDKIVSKHIFTAAGVSCPRAILYDPAVSLRETAARVSSMGGRRFVVKPVTGGSTVGVSIHNDAAAATEAAAECHAEFGDAMIEQFVAGREVTVGLLHGRALPIIEIVPKEGFYDYKAKYIAEDTQYLFDTIADAAIARRIQEDAVKCFRALECRDFARMDFMLAPDGTPYALEMNTIPGFTSHSLLPKAAARVGISMPQLCLDIVESAIRRHCR